MVGNLTVGYLQRVVEELNKLGGFREQIQLVAERRIKNRDFQLSSRVPQTICHAVTPK